MPWNTSSERALMLGEFSGDGDEYASHAGSGSVVNISCKVGATGVPVSVTATTSAGVAIDLTEYGDKIVVIERPTRRADVQVINNASITISGASSNVFTFQPDSTVLGQPADFVYSLREESTGDVIVQGRLAVAYAPLEDA